MPISRPPQEWPLLLCGPILRRVTPRSVSVFVALSRPSKVAIEVYDHPSPGTFDTPLPALLSYESVALGGRLHVAVAEWRGTANLLPSTVYGYDIRLQETQSPNPTVRLGDIGLLDGPHKLGYAERLPTFTLPPGLVALNIAHGSCRRVHAPGPDALALLDDLIGSDNPSATSRPHQLLLTGDQIYADDVAVCLLATLMDTATNLLEWANDETIPASSVPSGKVGPKDDVVLPGSQRRDFINKQTSFTAGAADPALVDGHLMFLGEFYAMYLMAWSDALWPRAVPGAANPFTLPTAEELQAEFGVAKFPNNPAYFAKLNAQRRAALEFARSLPRVRRALANVPTYMILDDHEVTDDWYLHRAWSESVRVNAAGRQIMRNALLAYAVFQDWGNHVENYAATTLGEQLLSTITYLPVSRLPRIQSQPSVTDELLDIQPTRVAAGKRMRWDWQYSIDGGEHQIIALDTRTWRSYPTSPKGNAALIESDATKTDIDLVAAGTPLGFQLLARKPTDGRLTVIISPAPVTGMPIAELLQKIAIARNPVTGREEFDNEAWSGDRVAFEDLLRRLASFQRSVVLSGDVHYAFSNQVSYFRKGATPARIIHLCASALKNQSDLTEKLGRRGYQDMPRQLGWLGFNRELTTLRPVLRGALDTSILTTADMDPALARDNARLLFMIELNDRFSRPAVLPAGRYTTRQAFELVRDVANDPTKGTDWRYTVTYLSDPATETQQQARFPQLQTLLKADPQFKHHNRLLVTSPDVVGINNLARISFSAQGGTTVNRLISRLYWQQAFDGTDLMLFTEHTASLDLPTPSEFPEVTQ